VLVKSILTSHTNLHCRSPSRSGNLNITELAIETKVASIQPKDETQ
jgi:hypothetical protein